MSRARFCIVKGCESQEPAPLHVLPSNAARREKWLFNLGRTDLRETYNTRTRVCNLHFEDHHFFYPGSKKLVHTAVPKTVFSLRLRTNEKSDASNLIDIDSLPSATEVTAPSLCDNKMLVKTKSTYSKHKYKMTYEEKEILPQPQITDQKNVEKALKDKNDPIIPTQDPVSVSLEDNFVVSDVEDHVSDESSAPINIDSSSTQNKSPKEQTLSIEQNDSTSSELNEQLVNSKKRKHSESDKEQWILTEETKNKYNDMLELVLEEVKSLPNFLDIIFGFLYKRTDFFQIPTEENQRIGLPSNVAKILVWQAFRKYEEIQKVPTKENVNEEPTKKQKRKKANETSELKVNNKSETKNSRSDVLPFNSSNGATYENYSWSQSTTDLDIQIKIPDKISCKQLHIDITSSKMLIKLKNSDTIYLQGDLCDKCKEHETVWSLGGQILQIHLEKESASLWDCLLKAEPRLHLNKMVSSQTLRKISEESLNAFEHISSDQINLTETLNDVWMDEDEESSFDFDPII